MEIAGDGNETEEKRVIEAYVAICTGSCFSVQVLLLNYRFMITISWVFFRSTLRFVLQPLESV